MLLDVARCPIGNIGSYRWPSTTGERMRETIEALMSEHITFETYEQWRREASQEVRDELEEGAAIPSWEVRQIIKRRTLLRLAERTTGNVSDAMRSVAQRLADRMRGRWPPPMLSRAFPSSTTRERVARPAAPETLRGHPCGSEGESMQVLGCDLQRTVPSTHYDEQGYEGGPERAFGPGPPCPYPGALEPL